MTDLTYVPAGEGFLYVAVILDVFSRRVVGWSMAAHMRTELVVSALHMALTPRRPLAGLLLHSDHGSQYSRGTALWHRDGEPPVPIHGVLLRDPTGTLKPVVLGCTNQRATPLQIVTWDVGCWNSAVTVEESRCRRGVETQRPWSRRSSERPTPGVLGLFSLVTVLAHALHGARLPTRASAWRAKPAATFADALAVVRRALWAPYLAHPPPASSVPAVVHSPACFLSSLVEAACFAA